MKKRIVLFSTIAAVLTSSCGTFNYTRDKEGNLMEMYTNAIYRVGPNGNLYRIKTPEETKQKKSDDNMKVSLWTRPWSENGN